jgi:hypothetical protein
MEGYSYVGTEEYVHAEKQSEENCSRCDSQGYGCTLVFLNPHPETLGKNYSVCASWKAILKVEMEKYVMRRNKARKIETDINPKGADAPQFSSHTST